MQPELYLVPLSKEVPHRVSSRALSYFSTLPSPQIGGAVLNALAQLGTNISYIRESLAVSNILPFDGEVPNLENIYVPSKVVISYLSATYRTFRNSGWYKRNRKKLKLMKYSDLKQLWNVVSQGGMLNNFEVTEPSDSKSRLVVIPKKGRGELYNETNLILKGSFYVAFANIGEKDLRAALEFLSDVGLGADVSTGGGLKFDTSKIKKIEEVGKGKFGISLGMFLIDGESPVAYRGALYDVVFRKNPPHARCYVSMEGALVRKVGVVGKNEKIEEDSYFVGSTIALPLGGEGNV